MADPSPPLSAPPQRPPLSAPPSAPQTAPARDHGDATVSMEKFVIEGGYPLSGELTPSGNKNEALPVLAACLLTDEVVTLRNMPRIRDVEVMCEVIEAIGGQARWSDRNTLRVSGNGVRTGELDPKLCQRIRASILFAGPLIARTGRVVLPPPGGDVIGRRRLDTHFHALEALGARRRARRL